MTGELGRVGSGNKSYKSKPYFHIHAHAPFRNYLLILHMYIYHVVIIITTSMSPLIQAPFQTQQTPLSNPTNLLNPKQPRRSPSSNQSPRRRRPLLGRQTPLPPLHQILHHIHHGREHLVKLPPCLPTTTAQRRPLLLLPLSTPSSSAPPHNHQTHAKKGRELTKAYYHPP